MTFIEELSSKSLLIKCWKKVRGSKPRKLRSISKGIDKITIDDFEDLNKGDKEIEKIAVLLSSGFFHFDPLKGIKKQKKGSPKDRLITAPTIKDRIVQKAIYSLIIGKVFAFINTGVSYSGVSKSPWGKKSSAQYTISTAIKKFIELVRRGNFYVYKTDINGFFDNVRKKEISKKIYSLLPDNTVNHLIKEIVNFELGNRKNFLIDDRIDLPTGLKGISQGSILSPLFSNIYLADFDREMIKHCGDKYIRYVDDYVILSKTKKESQQRARIAKEKLKTLKLTISKSKTTPSIDLRHKDITFLGLNISASRITDKTPTPKLNEKFMKETLNLKNEAYRKWMKLKGKKRRPMTLQEKIELMNHKVSGWVNYVKYYHVSDLFKMVNKIIIDKKRSIDFKNLDLIDLSINTKSLLLTEREWKRYFINP